MPWFFGSQGTVITPNPDQRSYRQYDLRFENAETVSTPQALFSGGSGTRLPGSLYYFSEGMLKILEMQGRPYPFSQRASDPPDMSGFLIENLLITVSETPDRAAYAYQLPQDPRGRIEVIPPEEFRRRLGNGDFSSTGLSLAGENVLYQGLPFLYKDMDALWGFNTAFAGWDKDFNYLGSEIYNRHGQLLETIKLNDSSGKYGIGYNPRFFDQEGNLFVFYEDNLFYLGRDWGYPPNAYGIINDDRINVRLFPGTTHLVLGQVQSRDRVRILEISEQEQVINSERARWHKIRTDSGLIGWIFGAFIDPLP